MIGFICLLALPACKPELLNSLLPPLEIACIRVPPGKTLCHFQETIELEAVLELNQEGPVKYAWICSAGVLSSNQGPRVTWRAPELNGVVEITVFVTHTLQNYTTGKTTKITVDASPLAPEEWETWNVGSYHVLPYELRGNLVTGSAYDWSTSDLTETWTEIDFNRNDDRPFLEGVKRVRCEVDVYGSDGTPGSLYFGCRPYGMTGEGFARDGGLLLLQHAGVGSDNSSVRMWMQLEFDINEEKMEVMEYTGTSYDISYFRIRLIGFYK